MRILDGIPSFYYEITSRQPVARIFEHRSMGYEDIKALLMEINQAFKSASGYLLDDNCFILDPEYIYMDVEIREFYFCYLPFYKGEVGASFHRLTEYILKKLDHEEEKAVLLGYQIYSRTMDENYSVSSVLSIFFQKLEEEKSPQKELQGNGSGVQERLRTSPIDSVDIQKIPQKVNKDPEKILKKHPMDQEKCRSVQKDNKGVKNNKKAGIIADFSIKEKKGLFKNTRKQTGKIRQEKKIKRKKILIVAAISFLTVGVIVIMSILHLLTLTQVGGLLFLAAGILIYLQSGKKDKEPQERKTEKRYFPEKELLESEKAEEFCDFYEEEETETKKEEQEAFGQTTLLRGGTPGEFPVLISIHSDLRDNMILDKEKMIVGKMKGQVDLPLNLSTISRIHASLECRPDGNFLTDLNSTNGTFLNGEQLEANESRELHTGDEIFFAGAGYYFKE